MEEIKKIEVQCQQYGVADMLMRGVMGGNAQVIEWSHTHNMNDYKDAGTYRIKGERTGNPQTDNLPIMNQGSGHTIEGILYVLDSSLANGSGKQDDCTITQFLMLSNRVGGQEGDMYMRSGYGANKDSLTWKPWEKYQTNMEVGCVSDDATHDATTLAPINSNGLKTFVDNGMYSGVYLTQEALNGDSTKAQTFVMVVINNYAAAGDNKTITQIKFAVATNGTYRQEYRTFGADGSWSEWNNEMAAVTIVNDLTTGGVNKALSAEMGKSMYGQMQSEIAGLGQGYNHQAGEIVKLYNACHIRNKVVNYSTIFYGQIVDGVVTITPTNTRWIYYFPVKSGDKVFFSGTVSSNKGIAYGYYAEEPKEGVAAIDFGEAKDNGQAFRYIDISNDGFFGVSYNGGYTRDLEIGFLLPVNEVVGPLSELKDDYRPMKIKYIPHRGIRDSEIPENTTYSVMFAALYGIKYAECDVRYTSDGVGVVMHDTTINRTMYNKDLTTIQESVAIADNTFETLSQYVYKSTNPVYRTELQTMKEYIDSCAQWDVCPIIQGWMSDEDLEYCMLKLGDNWICYGGNFEKVRAYSPNVLCLTSASYDSVDTMVSALKKIGGRVGLSRLYNDQLTDDYISACKANGWEVMASYAYQEQNIPDAIRRGVTIVLADNMGKETNKILASSLSDWGSFTHEGTVANGVLNLSAGQTLTYNLSEKGSYKIYAQFSGQGLFNLPTYGDSGRLERKDFAMANNVFQYVFLVTTGGHDIIITASTEMAISRLIVFHE